MADSFIWFILVDVDGKTPLHGGEKFKVKRIELTDVFDLKEAIQAKVKDFKQEILVIKSITRRSGISSNSSQFAEQVLRNDEKLDTVLPRSSNDSEPGGSEYPVVVTALKNPGRPPGKSIHDASNEELENERKRRKLEKTKYTRVLSPINNTQDIVVVSELKTAGISSEDSKILFIRKPARDLLTELSSDKEFIVVQGPPGAGKSIVVWLWSSIAASTKSVRWLHIDETKARYCDLAESKISDPVGCNSEEVIRECDADILVVDGLVKSSTSIFHCISNWKFENSTGKVVIVSSLQVEVKLENMAQLHITKISIPSWSIEEYKNAVLDPKLFSSVVKYLPDGDDPETKVMNKYFYAGGSARWMFGYSPENVIKDITDQLEKVPDFSALASGFTGCRSTFAVNHLFMLDAKNNHFLISSYVGRKVAEKYEEQFIHIARQSQLAETNPTFDGWLMEADFLMQLKFAKKHKNHLQFDTKHNSEKLKLSVSNILPFYDENDIEKFDKQLLLPNVWILPEKWNQGCYDAIQLLPDKGVRVYQITRAKSHDIKLVYIRRLLDALKKVGYTTSTLEIAVVIPDDYSKDKWTTIKFSPALGDEWQRKLTKSELGDYFCYGFKRTV